MPKEKKSIKVVLGLTLNTSQVLLCRRIESELPDIDQMWEIPGGKPEGFETPKQTAVRELFEETGYTVRAEQYIPFPFIVTRKYDNLDLIVHIICVICHLSTEHPRVISKDKKIADVRWFNFEEINLMNVIAGSREFLAWSIQNIAKVKNAFGSTRHISNIVFENIDHKKNNYKYYFIQCEYDPEIESSYKIYKIWGRITKKYTGVIELLLEGEEPDILKKIKISSYENSEAFSKALKNIMNERVRHGYYVIDYSDNFPVKAWLVDHKDIITSSRFPQQSLDIFT